jgi:hypothetical protein
MQLSVRQQLIGLWIIIGLIAVISCCVQFPSAHLGSEYLPVGNDSFYHARRILDTAADPSSFYQFDKRIHAPEGSLLCWPWGYDYVLGWVVRLGMMTGITTQPMAILIWVPPLAVLFSVGFMMTIARRLGLSVWSTALAGLCVALAPLTQGLHGVGNVDHHFAEYIFLLATIAAGLKWFAKPEDTRAAVTLGVVLGTAPAIHNGLFVLQLPIVAMFLFWWLQDIRVPLRSTLYFSGALLTATVLVLLPSLPFRLGRFEFYTLSWFHLYAAVGTSLATTLLSWLPRTRRSVGVLLGAVLVFLAPLGHQILIAHSFLVGNIKRLDGIGEMHSVRQFAIADDGLVFVSSLYSLLIWLWPITVGFCLYRAWVERARGRLFFWVCAVCGLTLLVMQFRLHYYGSFALFLPWLVVAEDIAKKRPQHARGVMLATSLVLILAFGFSLRNSIPSMPDPGGDSSVVSLRLVLDDLRKACAKEPGIVLADNDAGHYIRYFTDCSVIADNFLLTKQHEQKIDQIDYLTSLSAAELPKKAPYVRYLLLRPVNILPTEKGFTYVSYSPKRAPLLIDLLLTEKAETRAPYTLLREGLMDTQNPKIKAIPLFRLYKVERPKGTALPPLEGPALSAAQLPPLVVTDNSRH